jgi:PAS domain S-box-containing protein
VIQAARAESQRDATLEALRESEQKFRSFVEESAEGLALIDEQGKIIEWNQAYENITGLKRDEVLGKAFLDVQSRVTAPERRSPDRYEYYERVALDALRTGQSPLFDQPVEGVVCRADGERRYVQQTVFPIKTDKGYRIGSVTRDITERVRAEEERERLIQELQDALAQVKTLSGLLPICANCKKIRDDGGYWHEVEVYVRDHSEADFTHGLCPKCIKELYPDFIKRDKEV